MADTFQGPTPSGQPVGADGAYGESRTDTAYRARMEAKRVASLTPEQRQIEDLLKRVAELEKKTDIKVECGDGITWDGHAPSYALNLTGNNTNTTGNGFSGYPWITSIWDKVNFVWAVIFGAGNSSFAGAAQPIKQMEVEVADPADANASQMTLMVGDSGGNDQLSFGVGAIRGIKITWGNPNNSGRVDFIDSLGNGIGISSTSLVLVSPSGDKISLATSPGSGALNLTPITISGTSFYAFQ